jgi:hypothetical protein
MVNKYITYLLTPTRPNVLVREISGRIHALSRRWSGCLIQSSQKAAGHLASSSAHTRFSNIQPRPGKKIRSIEQLCTWAAHDGKAKGLWHAECIENYRKTINLSRTINERTLPALLSTKSPLPLSFHADTHHNVGSACRMGYVAAKYSKKSGDMSRSSE